MLEWLIIGGGIHGTYLSLYLTRRKNVAPDHLRVLDPYPEPLALWNHFAANTGMAYLRSSHAHNLHYDPFSLVTFTRTQAGAPLAQFIEPYGRPSLELFQAHNRLLIERYHLDSLRLTGRATGLRRIENGWCVETDAGALDSRRVIIAIGSTEQPYWPEWTRQLQAAGAPIHHIFDPSFRRDDLPDWSHLVVIGGGITAAQTAMTLALRQPGHVTLLMRHPLRIHQFDSDTGWITHQYLDSFYHERDYSRRRAIISEARHRGSMPKDIADELQRALDSGLLALQHGDVMNSAFSFSPSPFTGRGSGGGVNQIQLTLSSGETLTADQLILATGFESRRPGGDWLDSAIAHENLPLAPDDYPIVDSTLCWSPGLYVTGSLAELEIGPVARNMVGVRLAAERIGAYL